MKRPLDLLAVGLSAVVWLPALAITAAAVRFLLGRPVLFRQKRIGLDEKPFILIKFRTMTDARASNGSLLPDSERLTRFGRFLRHSSLDELPSLVNVITGDMSLVGPRPLLPEYLTRYSTTHRRRHQVRPGITGLAQTNGRNSLTWRERFDLDVRYVEECSLRIDLMILLKTAGKVVARHDVDAPTGTTMKPFEGYD